MKQNEHGRIIAAAAKRHLQPLGLRRKGESRFWQGDQGWRLEFVEFQPSGFSKGSYLNVGLHWLWYEFGCVSFNVVRRPHHFVAFIDAAQFTPEAESLASSAAAEIIRNRAIYPTLADVAARLTAEPPFQGWPTFHAGIAAGLVGDTETARRLFERVSAECVSEGWQADLGATAAALAALLDDPEAYRAHVCAAIGRQRAALKLPLIEDPFASDLV